MSLAHTHASITRSDPAAPRRKNVEKQRILAAVDGSEQTNPVVEYILGLSLKNTVEVIVLNVQPEPEDWRLRGYGSFKRDEIRRRLIDDLGRPVVSSAGKKLKEAGITARTEIRIGDPAAEIALVAKQENCDLIVVGERKARGLSNWLARNTGISLGSLTGRVIQLADTPVVIVK